MTAQISESIIYEGENRSLLSCPLSDFFSLSDTPSPFQMNCTALWRGYLGSWEIIQGRLYLIEIKAGFDDDNQTTLKDIFPGFSDRVFAHWYTGELRIPDGEQIQYEHNGFGSQYESDILIQIKQGAVESVTIKNNIQGNLL
jgi:hypothetical protein